MKEIHRKIVGRYAPQKPVWDTNLYEDQFAKISTKACKKKVKKSEKEDDGSGDEADGDQPKKGASGKRHTK